MRGKQYLAIVTVEIGGDKVFSGVSRVDEFIIFVVFLIGAQKFQSGIQSILPTSLVEVAIPHIMLVGRFPTHERVFVIE